jgi:hypothetical protein
MKSHRPSVANTAFFGANSNPQESQLKRIEIERKNSHMRGSNTVFFFPLCKLPTKSVFVGRETGVSYFLLFFQYQAQEIPNNPNQGGRRSL